MERRIRYRARRGSGLAAILPLVTALAGGAARAQWQARAPMPYPAGQAAIARGLDGRFYLFGGWNSNPPTLTQTSRLQIYDSTSDAWASGATVPAPCVGAAVIITAAGTIHLLNGHNSCILPYNPDNDTWLASRSASWITYSAGSVRTPDNRYFVFGGERPASLSYEYFPDTFSAVPRAEASYNPEPAPRSIRYPGVYVEAVDALYVLGGMSNWWTNYGAFSAVAVYHPSSNTWTQGFTAMPTRRFSFGYVRGWNGYFYAIGGSDVYTMQAAPRFSSVDIYDPVADRWHAGPSLPVGLRECAAGIDDQGVIYVFGGSADPDGRYVNTVWANDTRVSIAGPSPADLDRDGDVDSDDVALFNGCATGPDLGPAGPCCRNADLDRDGDVDQSDFGLIQACFTGPNLRVDPECSR